MTREDKIAKLLDIINEIKEDGGQEPIATIDEASSLRRDIGFDSMDLAVMTAKLEDEFDVDVFEAGLIDSVKEILDRL